MFLVIIDLTLNKPQKPSCKIYFTMVFMLNFNVNHVYTVLAVITVIYCKIYTSIQ